MKWKALTIYNYYDGPIEFTAYYLEDELYPAIYYFRYTGGGDDNRLFQADIPEIERNPIYVYERDVDWSSASR